MAQKSYNDLSVNVGVHLLSPKFKSSSLTNSFNAPLTLEYQKRKKESFFAIGLQLEYSYRAFYIDSNVYSLLKDKCKPNTSFVSGYYCIYSSDVKSIDLNFPISYSRNILTLKKINMFFKVGAIVNFTFYTHYKDKYPLLDPVKQVLLDPGPFIAKYHSWRFNYQDYNIVFGSGLKYKISTNVALVGVLQYQRGFRYSFQKDKLVILVGSTFKI